MSSSSHHLLANLPNAGIERGGEHGSFMRGDEASSSMKGCSLCMYLRCGRATRASARDICSTLPARRVDLRRFTRAVTRMYLLCSDALRVLHRTWTGPWRRCVSRDPSAVWSPRSCRAGGSRGRYTRVNGSRPSRGAVLSFYRRPYP